MICCQDPTMYSKDPTVSYIEYGLYQPLILVRIVDSTTALGCADGCFDGCLDGC